MFTLNAGNRKQTERHYCRDKKLKVLLMKSHPNRRG
jgi:hypothetical protein